MATFAIPALTVSPQMLVSAADSGKPPPHTPVNEAASYVVSHAEFLSNWPRFRGWDGSGVSTHTNVPLSWDGHSGKNVAWKSPVPASGHGSPIVWGQRVFLSGGDAAARFVFCFDTSSGKLLWQREIKNVPGSPEKQPEVPEMTGFASPTMATDGRGVFAMFANGDLAAFTLDGSGVWSTNVCRPRNMYGHASSLAIWPGKLIVQVDQDEGAPGGSKLFALDCATGRVLWHRARQSDSTWATPIVIETGEQTQIVTHGQPWVVAYSLADGNERWRAELLSGEVTPSPIFAGGLVMAINPSAKLLAVRPDGAGNVTKSHIAWAVEDNIPDVTSPVSNGQWVFTVTTGGVATCFDIKDGKRVWEHDLDMEVQSSLSIVGNRLLVLGTKGITVVIETGHRFEEVERSALPDEFMASPAFANGRVFLRGTTNLWCLGEKE